MKKIIFIFVITILIVCSFEACDYFAHANNKNDSIVLSKPDAIATSNNSDSIQLESYVPCPNYICDLERKVISLGLVDIHAIDTSIVVDLKYSTINNFLGIDMYGDFNKCYLQPDVAQKLICCQEELKSKFPFYNLLIFDAVRARSFQRKMWDTLNVPYSEKSKYVSNPIEGSLHNFGAAVDVSIIDAHGIELDMGTPYDYFGELAYPREEERLLEEGKLTRIQLLNRKLLRDLMESSGFMGITTEWWHFNSCYRVDAYDRYKIIE